MFINRIDLKNRAKQLIRDAKPKIIVAGLFVVLLNLVVGFLSNRLIGLSDTEMERVMQLISDGSSFDALVYWNSLSTTAEKLINLALNIVLQIVSMGFVIFLLNSIRNAGAVYGNLLDGFGMFWRIIALNILESIFIFLWTLLFIFPGIIAAYRYRMAIYLLIDHPEMSPMACIRESKRMMKGHKAELFVLELSFFGWYLLAGVMEAIYPYLVYAVYIWVTPYTSTVFAIYYEQLRRISNPDSSPSVAGERVDYIDNGNDSDSNNY